MMELRELTLLSVGIRIAAAILLSGVIGLERGLKNRAAGFRTYMLVCIGACMVMMTNQYIYQALGTGDPVRMGAQVVSGIGFLGAGSIIVTTHNQIKGLTTAAGLWASACIGLAIGIGFYEVAVIGSVAVFLSMTILHTWEDHMRRNTRIFTMYFELLPEKKIVDILKEAREREISLSNVQIESDNTAATDTICFLATVKGKRKLSRDALMKQLEDLPSVLFMEEL